MKQKDLVLIIFVAIISGAVALALSKVIISNPKNRQQAVEVVDAISPEFKTPDPRYFNKEAINPTRTIIIGDNVNPNPFTGQ